MTEQEFLKDLTPEQRAATLKFDDDVSVTANAGSGKTTLLVRKYLYLQLFHPDKFNYKNIVAITFTNKAASEIRKKIRETIIELFNKKKTFENIELDKNQIEILDRINRNLVNLEVGTIHKFCRGLIKDHAFRAGLEPNFTVLEENEKNIVLTRIINDVLGESDSPYYNNIAKSILFLGVQDTISLILSLVYKQVHLDKQLQFYEQDCQTIVNQFLTQTKETNKQFIFRIINQVNEECTSIRILKDKTIEKLQPVVDDFYTSELYDSVSINEILLKLQNLRGVKEGNSLAVKKIIGAIAFEEFDSLISNYDEIIKGTSEESNLLLENRIEVGLSLTILAKEVAKRYSELNYKSNRIDNDSTIDIAVELLNIPVVKEIVQDELAYVMIDEFQDTDDRQLAIANLIRDTGEVKIFVVGDDKQSIYRFRNADVRVFKNLRSELDDANRLELNTSFRSDLVINAFVNDLFSPYMDSSISEFDIDYQSIVSFHSEVEEDYKKINLMLYDAIGETKEADGKVGSYNQLMKSIDYLINVKGAQPEDICILSNSTTHFPPITKILAEKGLEYNVMAGKGFFDKNEVKSLISYIQFIESPENDMLCAAALKSSLFNYSDNDLFNIGKNTNSELTFWKKFQEFANKSNNPLDKEISTLLDKSIQLSNKLPLSNIIIKIIDESNWNYFYQSDKNQATVFRNLYRFMGYVSSLEDRAYGSLGQAFELLDFDFMRNNKSEDVGKAEKAIKLSTIHSAKGLEFPHVIILDFDLINIPKGAINSSKFDEGYGFTMKIPTSIENYYEFATSETVIDLMIKEHDKIAAKAENLRVLYVAATRAKNSLHLLIKNGETSKPILELQRIFDDFKTTPNLKKHSSIVLYKKDETNEGKDFEYSIHTDSEFSSIDDYTFNIERKEKKIDPNAARYIGTVEALEKEISFSATKLAMLQDIRNKEKFKEVYIFGLPILKPSTLNFDKEEYEEIEDNKTSDGTDYGIFFHAIMENISTILKEDNTISNREIEKVLDRTALQYQIKVKSGDINKLTIDLQRVLDSEFISNHQQVLRESLKEFDLKLAFGDHTLTAIYDAISFDGGNAEIWDWKTNNFHAGDTLESKANKYSLQMNMYALFAFRYNEKIEKVNSRLFFINKLENTLNDEDWIYSKTYTRADVPRLQIEIAELIGVIKGRYPNTYPVAPVDLSE
ncbi:MAG: hypothetical protein CVV25_03540 [Ignavibacteriae bacterium HGW-Ignavibacteriae-4]|jgi:ATP-dependent helicase/nuclease subunit A|nr:MAG: hypothetical protein CVV25_03540 [Ignavibacteriae bacterium HGW-Ignavibacteriae-4]